ncbi:hypothetical protein N7522_004055 [Penicillium canescens]|nr:hypothetical protein N7522_004055 [Penicillium canescens]
MTKSEIMTVLSVKENLTSQENQEHQFPVNYAYDYLNGGIGYLSLPPLTLNKLLQTKAFLQMADQRDHSRRCTQRSDNAIDLSPLTAGLPWATGILSCRQNKHWNISIETTRIFLQHLAADKSTQDLYKSGHSVAEISQKELDSTLEEGWVKFPTYLFPEGDKQRTKLLAAINVFIFVFDDFWEMHDITSVSEPDKPCILISKYKLTSSMSKFTKVQDEFIARMQPRLNNIASPKTKLQVLIDQAIEEIYGVDRASGNTAGQEMLELMVRFFSRPPPPTQYKDMEEFLLYRHVDAAVPYILGCTKFSLNSSVDLDSPRLARYLRLVKDHVSVANDLGSWEKEKKAFDTGKVLYMINAVDVVKDLFKLPSYSAAKLSD